MRCKDVVNIYEFYDYRRFLREYYKKRKHRDGSFTYRSFARDAGFSAANFYKLVADGKRNLSQDSAMKFARGLSLNKRETGYFENLVHFTQASTTEMKSTYFGRLAKFKGYRDQYLLDQQGFNYFQHWYVPVIRELTTVIDFKEDPKWIAQALSNLITPSQADKSLNFLIEEGFLCRNEDGKLEVTSMDILSGPVARSLALRGFHKAMAEQARQAIDLFPKEERDFSFLTLPVKKADFEALREDIKRFRKNILKKYRTQTEREVVYQLNLQLFEVANPSRGETS